MRNIHILLFASIFLAACSGGDDKNILPEVNVNSVVELNESESFTLSANPSDTDGTIESVVWSYVSGAQLNTTTDGDSITFLPIDITQDVTSVYSVTVTDNRGDIATATTNVTVRYINIAPAVSITSNIDIIPEGDAGFIEINLSDADDNISTVTWTELTSNNLSFIKDNNNNISFVAPDVTADTLFELEVNVIDIEGETATDTISFFVGFVNEPPLAVLPLSRTIDYGDELSVSGEASNDADGQTLSYNWSITSAPEGSSANLINPNSTEVTLNYDVLGAYELSLTVNDGITDSNVVSQTFTVFDVLNSLTLNLNKPSYPLDDIGDKDIPLGEVLSPTVIANFNAAGDTDVTAQSTINATEGIFTINSDMKQITAVSTGTGDIEISYDGTTELVANINVVNPAFKKLQVDDSFTIYEGRELNIYPKAIYTNGESVDYSAGEWVAKFPDLESVFSISNGHSFLPIEAGNQSFNYVPIESEIESVSTQITALDIAEVSNLLSTSSSKSTVNINGRIQSGSQFSATLINNFSEDLYIDNIVTLDGDGRTQTFSLDELISNGITNDSTLNVNESVGIRVTISFVGASLPYRIIFNLSDPVTGKAIEKAVVF